jgi:hypothetical protein
MKNWTPKVGDLVIWAAKREPMVPKIDKSVVYIVSNVHDKGYLDFKGVKDRGWFPENFELAKSQIINNILNDL